MRFVQSTNCVGAIVNKRCLRQEILISGNVKMTPCVLDSSKIYLHFYLTKPNHEPSINNPLILDTRIQDAVNGGNPHTGLSHENLTSIFYQKILSSDHSSELLFDFSHARLFKKVTNFSVWHSLNEIYQLNCSSVQHRLLER